MDDYLKIRKELLGLIYNGSYRIKSRLPIPIGKREKYFNVNGITVGELKQKKVLRKHEVIANTVLAELLENDYILCCEPNYTTIENVNIVKEKDRYFATCREDGCNLFSDNGIILVVNANKAKEVSLLVHQYKAHVRCVYGLKTIPSGVTAFVREVVMRRLEK